MFVHNINPVILEIGKLQIRYYGLAYAIGLLLIYYSMRRNKEKLKITFEQIDNILLWLAAGMFVGARLFSFLFSEPEVLLNNPLEFFAVWHGGMSFFGGFVGAFIAAFIYVKKNKINWKILADTIMIPLVFSLFLGRIANFINGELVGTPSTLPWCVVFPEYSSLCRHPYQLYAALSHLLLFFGLLYLSKKIKKEGIIFYSFLIGYGFLRLISDFFRDDARFLGLTVWQYMCVVCLGAGIFFLVKGRNKANMKPSI
ncbi:prolipoprotein diacylglyceryl transferase [Candidatus Woesearchaeota archaeon]|nr:prolipoprotein diacylglyceryl transferase [Candidatus Woesearchaeota archaeon]